MNGFFDLLIGDEVHEYKGRGSAQGIAAGVLADACGKSLTLTGTLLGGYSSTLFHLLYRFSPEIRTEFGRSEESRWVTRYGFLEHTINHGDDGFDEDGRVSRHRNYRKTVRERPGRAPSALFHLIGNSIFLRLSDVASGLPPYEEQVMLSGVGPGAGPHRLLPAQRPRPRLRHPEGGPGRRPLQGLQETPGHLPPDAPAGLPRRLHPWGDGLRPPDWGPAGAGAPTGRGEALPQGEGLVELVSAERKEGRRVLVYATHTGTRDITQRMEDFLTRHGYRVAVMKAKAVPPERREAWVGDRVKEGVDVVVCHPRLVQTGLDLVDFPTIVWFETDYSVYVMRQASRRSWRIGQTRPVKVVFMAYRNTLQADALKLVAKKLQSSLAVEGELPEDGLSAYGDDGDDLMLALARRIVNGEADESETVEAVFASARDAESEAEELLVDDGWKAVGVEPEILGVNGNVANGNGHHDASSLPRTGYGGIGQTVELVLEYGDANGNGNGHHEEAPEPQQSLFSWSEFMTQEPVKSKGKQPATISMFEWALSMEEERGGPDGVLNGAPRTGNAAKQQRSQGD